jgi:acyl-CoA reductase-like NAD-dependent aldehyde dehydrogenase
MRLKDAALFKQQAYVDGTWIPADSGATFEVTNPSTGAVLGNVPNMGAAEARRAIEAADRTLPSWRDRTAKDRAVILRDWFNLMMDNQEDLARVMTVEQGKPLAEIANRNRLFGRLPRMVRRRGRRSRFYSPRDPRDARHSRNDQRRAGCQAAPASSIA